jgi:hypothetical protein
MERLETVVDSSVEKQAVEEMRREIGALFAEQRQNQNERDGSER